MTPPAPSRTPDKTPEEIEQEMFETRGAITEKVAALENQVVGTVQTAADTLTGTVESVKGLLSTAPGAVSDTVKQAAAAVRDTMKETFDITGHVRAHPLAAVGVSMLAGGVVGYLLGGGRRSPVATEPSAAPLSVSTAYTPPARTAASPPSAPGVFDDLISMVGRKFREVAENAIDTAAAAVNNSVREGVPKLVDSATELAADRLMPGDSPDGGRRSRSVVE